MSANSSKRSGFFDALGCRKNFYMAAALLKNISFKHIGNFISGGVVWCSRIHGGLLLEGRILEGLVHEVAIK